GHLGMTRTWARVQARFWWRGAYRHVRRFVLGCHTCQLNRIRRSPPQGLMQSFTEVTLPFQRLSIDFIGPFNASNQGNKYALIMVDHFSRYVEAKAVPQATTEQVIDALLEKVIY